MLKVDARGVSCPQPILMTKQAIKDYKGDIEIIVDQVAAKSNVERFLKNFGCKDIIIKENEEDIIIHAVVK